MDIFKHFPEIITGTSTKNDGSMGLSWKVAEDNNIKERRVKFLDNFGIGIGQLVTASLMHGDHVAVVGADDSGKVIPDTDALIIKSKNIFLSITVADCLPIFYFDPVHQIIALAHAGWRGAMLNIAGNVVQTMKKKFGCNPAEILVGVGPHICGEHYEVQSDVASKFDKYGSEVVVSRDGRVFLDLAKAVSIQLLNRGVIEKHIEISKECTWELIKKYYSFRRDKPDKLETILAFIGLRHG